MTRNAFTEESLIGYVQDAPGSRVQYLIRELEPGEAPVEGRSYSAQIRNSDGTSARVIRPLRRGVDGGLWLDFKSEARANISLANHSFDVLAVVAARWILEE